MNLLLKIIIPLLVLACILPFFLRGKNGKPLLTLDKFEAPKIAVPDLRDARVLLDKTREKVRDSLPEKAAKPVQMYKWRDAGGSVHLSDRPNPNGPCETIMVNPGANLVPAGQSHAAAIATDKGKPAAVIPSLTTVPLEEVPELVDDAREVRNLSAQREKSFAQSGN